ncbi:unnamed protein product [Fraxinus pennsylvanica]|uniref:Ribosomal protein L18 n=1 Tax=Fraxinus pennsylvanica TaxID=56036 RepID=A0AAD2DIT9_9LAMI|nr:unnamed protein product [Fraxinus pennsylvanica]
MTHEALETNQHLQPVPLPRRKEEEKLRDFRSGRTEKIKGVNCEALASSVSFASGPLHASRLLQLQVSTFSTVPRQHLQAEMVILGGHFGLSNTKFLKPYVLKMHFTNKYVSAQVIHTPTATVASAASTQEKALRLSMEKAKENTRDVAAAAKIGKILGERLMLQSIPAVSVALKREQKYHGKVKAVIDSLREAGVNFL